jgi:hypothetical protein
MTAIVVANSIPAAVVIGGLAAAMRLGHLTAGNRFELHRGRGEQPQATVRRAA